MKYEFNSVIHDDNVLSNKKRKALIKKNVLVIMKLKLAVTAVLHCEKNDDKQTNAFFQFTVIILKCLKHF